MAHLLRFCGVESLFWVSSGNKANNPKKQYGTDYRSYESSDNTWTGANSKKAENPAAKDTANDAYYKIDNEAEASAAHDFAGNKARNEADEDIPDKFHIVEFMLLFVYYKTSSAAICLCINICRHPILTFFSFYIIG